MPYLHWNFVNKQNESTRQWTERKLNKRVEPSDIPEDHPRRSLDEAHVRTQTLEDLELLNADQVVIRYWHDAVQTSSFQATMMVVDQLWLWVLDDGKSSCLNDIACFKGRYMHEAKHSRHACDPLS
jgi:hypothetical protein